MYAVMLGLRNDYRLAFAPKAKKISFQYYMKHWTPVDLVDYIVMGTLSKSDIDFNALENKNEKEVDEEILKLRKLIEEYANGGFDKIRAKLESEPNFLIITITALLIYWMRKLSNNLSDGGRFYFVVTIIIPELKVVL